MRLFPVIVVTCVLAIPQPVSAQVPQTLSYQGFLKDPNGQPVNGNLPMTFRLFAQESGGAEVWSQSFPGVLVSDGVYNVFLDVPNVPFDNQYWMETVISGQTSTGRTRLASSAYSLGPWTTAQSTQSAEVKIAGEDGVDPRGVEANIYYNNGNVGIGTSAPVSKLEIVAQDGLTTTGYQPFLTLRDANANNKRGRIHSVDGSLNLLANSFLIGSNPFAYLKLHDNGNVGIGSSTPLGKLEIVGQDAIRLVGGQPFLTLHDANTGYARSRFQGAGGSIFLETEAYISSGGNPSMGLMVMRNATGNVGIGVSDPQTKLDVNGTTRTQVLQITGGSDLAEPFETALSEAMESGTLMVIDDEHPGKLRVSTSPYDSKVAGIVSGAGGVEPGLTLRQTGTLDGKNFIALAGRVYCKVEAFSSPINPGDLLTSSSLPGYAMRAIDKERSHGAIIGKAMTRLQEGKGLVLVLVNLQ